MSEETGQFVWFWGTTALLAVALYYPVGKFIWVKRVRRLEKELKRDVTNEERDALKRRTRIISSLIVIVFAYLFNKALL